MTLPLALFALLGGFALLIAGGEALVRSAISLAVRTKISPAIISLTVVAAGTSAPELFTSVSAALQDTPDISAGNVLGSNIFNVWAILGLSFLLAPIDKISHRLGFEWKALFIATLMTLFVAMDYQISRVEGLLFACLFIMMTYLSIRRARQVGLTSDDDDEPLESLKNPYWDALYLIVGLGSLMGGAQLALEGGVYLGQLAGMNDKIIGITIISVGTGLPELATSAVAAFRGRSDIAIGNVLGSNIMNTLAVLGFTAAIHPLKVTPELAQIDVWFFLLSTLMLWPIILGIPFTLGRRYGVTMLSLYLIYIVGTLTHWKINL